MPSFGQGRSDKSCLLRQEQALMHSMRLHPDFQLSQELFNSGVSDDTGWNPQGSLLVVEDHRQFSMN